LLIEPLFAGSLRLVDAEFGTEHACGLAADSLGDGAPASRRIRTISA